MKVRGLSATVVEFVRGAGGEVIPESSGRRADFLFRRDNVVAELKTLKEEALREHALKLQPLVNDWMRRRQVLIYGRTLLALQKVPAACQQEWLRLLQAPVENVIRDANRQIRSTKAHYDLPTAKGLVLIANEANLLYTTPSDYLSVAARALQKRAQNGDRRFREIEAVVYLSIHSVRDRLLPIWQAGFINMADERLNEFVTTLQQRWFAFLSRGRIIRA